jgi:hypothetical protein
MALSDYIKGIDAKKTWDGIIPNPHHTCIKCKHGKLHEEGTSIYCTKYQGPRSKAGTCASWELKDTL